MTETKVVRCPTCGGYEVRFLEKMEDDIFRIYTYNCDACDVMFKIYIPINPIERRQHV